MAKYIFYLIFLLIPVLNQAGSDTLSMNLAVENDLYADLDLIGCGLSKEVFELAMKGYSKLEDAGQLANPGILTIVDFSQSSKNKRMYVIDMKEHILLFNTLVAHGRNTGEEFAKYFSNDLGTLKSSLGFYITQNHVMGNSVGLSLIIRGVENGFNNNAISRQIVMHGAEYATEKFIQKTGRLGRSYGCPSLPPELIKPVIASIEKGTCLFIYNPDSNYLRQSALLN